MSWRAKDFEDGTFGLEIRREGGWKVVEQNQKPLTMERAERDVVLREILIGVRNGKYKRRR